MKIYVLKLNLFSILPMLFFRLIGYKVYFLDCGKWWRKKTVFNILSSSSLIWINHQEYGEARWGGISHDIHIHTIRIGKLLFALESFQRLVDAFSKDTVLQPSIYQRVFSTISDPIELIHSIPQYVSRKLKIKVWMPNTIITRNLLDSYPGLTNLCPRVWTTLELLFDLGYHVISKVAELALQGLNRIISGSKIKSKVNNLFIQSDSPALENVEVAYFPHKGVFYGNLFLKDHFYSTEKNSPFYHEKILHLELTGNKHLSSQCLEYYRTKNIRNYNWQAMPFNKRDTAISLIQFLSKALKHGFGGFDIDLLIKYSFIVWSVQTSLLKLQNLPNLKVVLIGYDILFPQPLSVACRLAGIKTVAVQERFFTPWMMPPMLIEHYFVMGPEVRNYLKPNAPPFVSFHEIGPVRLKDHTTASIPEIVVTIRNKYSGIVLAIDFHSEVGWFENGRCVNNNWRNNMIFYDHILNLCCDFPDTFFLLKGKNIDFTKIPFFKERVDQFRAQPNLLILEDPNLWTPFSSVASADIAVARLTSLADEMLALGKPVIFDDYDGLPSKIYDYGPEVTAYDYDDIKAKLASFFADPAGYNANLNSLRKKLYSIPVEPVEQIIQKELIALWKKFSNCVILICVYNFYLSF